MQAETHQDILDRAADPIVFCDVHATVVYANAAAGDCVGRSLSEITDEATEWECLSRTDDGGQIWMRRRAEHRTSVMRASRVAALGELAVGVSHEVKNPLMMMTGLLELALQGLPDGRHDQVENDVRGALEASRRITEVLDRLLAFAQGPTLTTPQPVALANVIGQTLALLHERMTLSGVRCHVELPPTLCVWGFPDALGQVFLHLLLNAREAISRGPGWVRIEYVDEADSDVITLLVRDSGPGVPEPLRQRIFEPYFSTKQDGPGTGLGLSISREVVASHGGTLDYVVAGEQCAFRITLPWHDDPVTGHDR